MEKIEYGAVTRFLTNQKKFVHTILERISLVYGDSCPGKNIVY